MRKFRVLAAAGIWFGLCATTFVIKENGVEVGRWEEADGKDEVKVVEGEGGAETGESEVRQVRDGNGKLERVERLQNGVVISAEEYSTTTGKILARRTYNNQGLMEGMVTTYFSNGTLKTRAAYRAGKLEGLCEIYLSTGHRLAMADYSGGMLHGEARVFAATLNHGNGCTARFENGKFAEWLRGGRCFGGGSSLFNEACLGKSLSDQEEQALSQHPLIDGEFENQQKILTQKKTEALYTIVGFMFFIFTGMAVISYIKKRG